MKKIELNWFLRITKHVTFNYYLTRHCAKPLFYAVFYTLYFIVIVSEILLIRNNYANTLRLSFLVGNMTLFSLLSRICTKTFLIFSILSAIWLIKSCRNLSFSFFLSFVSLDSVFILSNILSSFTNAGNLNLPSNSTSFVKYLM